MIAIRIQTVDEVITDTFFLFSNEMDYTGEKSKLQRKRNQKPLELTEKTGIIVRTLIEFIFR